MGRLITKINIFFIFFVQKHILSTLWLFYFFICCLVCRSFWQGSRFVCNLDLYLSQIHSLGLHFQILIGCRTHLHKRYHLQCYPRCWKCYSSWVSFALSLRRFQTMHCWSIAEQGMVHLTYIQNFFLFFCWLLNQINFMSSKMGALAYSWDQFIGD
mgnify:FL=1